MDMVQALVRRLSCMEHLQISRISCMETLRSKEYHAWDIPRSREYYAWSRGYPLVRRISSCMGHSLVRRI
jgi:hypothetical protein